MSLHFKPHLLLAAALCMPAGDLAAHRTQQDSAVTLRVRRGAVDTLAPRADRVRMRPGDMIVRVTAQQPQRVSPPLRADRPSPVTEPPASPAELNELSNRRERPKDDPPAPAEPSPPPGPATGGVDDTTPVGQSTQAAEPVAYALGGYEIETHDTRGRAVRLMPLVEIGGAGLQYDPRENAYTGVLHIMLLDADRPAATGTLPEEVVLEVTGEIESVEAVRLRNINMPYHKVRIRVSRPRADTVHLRIIPTFDPLGGKLLPVPVRRPVLSLQVSPKRIAGLGLEVAELIVMNPDNNDTIPVVLASLLAKPKPPQVRASREGGVSRIRSSSIGVDTVSLVGGVYLGSAEIHYIWPVAFLLAALFGGLVGGVLNALSTRRRRNRRIIGFLAAQGALTGAVGAILYAVGINVVGWAPDADYGEGLMFAVAFVCGLMGPRIFDRFLPRLSAGSKGRDDAPPSAPPAAPSAPEPAAVG